MFGPKQRFAGVFASFYLNKKGLILGSTCCGLVQFLAMFYSELIFVQYLQVVVLVSSNNLFQIQLDPVSFRPSFIQF